ncbi:MAG: tail fiber domain-containing protein [Cytophagales bacterium]|nr:tail fiber domain-containing protein [Cytophagales bacterium]
MSIPNNHSFSSAFPFEIKIENQFMDEGHSTLYIVNKIDEAATEQQLKLLINVVAPGQYTFKAMDSTKSPGPNYYHMALAFRPGVLLDAVAQSFHQVLTVGIDEALGKDNTCIVHGPVLRSDKAKVWYVTFKEDVTTNCATQPSVDWIAQKEATDGLQLTRFTISPDGHWYGIDINHKLYAKTPGEATWKSYSWSRRIESMTMLPNKHAIYVGLDNTLVLSGLVVGEQNIWHPYQPLTYVRSIVSTSKNNLIGINQQGHLVHIELPYGVLKAIPKVLDTSLTLISVGLFPDGRILGVDSQHDLHEWNESINRWSPILSSTKLLDVTVDADGNVFAVGTDHQIYRQSLTYSPKNVLNIPLKGISAAAGTGARSSQIECQFGKVHMNGNPHDFKFKANTQVSIVNHQGSGYAPLHFGILGSDVMVKDKQNTLKPYFLTQERVPITLGKETTITFTFPYTDGNKFPGIGKSDQVEGISGVDADEHFTAEPKKQDTTHHTWNFSFKGNDDLIGAQLFEGIFEFRNIQVSDYRGPVIVEVVVKNLPGYWDSVFQIPVVIGDSSLTDALNLVTTTKGGNSENIGSKINFFSGGTHGKGLPSVAIEENWGLELYGSLPNTKNPVVKHGQGIRVRRANLIIPEGKLAIGTKESISAAQGNTHIFPEGSNATLYVEGDSQLHGDVSLTGNLIISRDTWNGGTKFGLNSTTHQGATDIYNLYIHPDKKDEKIETLAFQFHQRTNDQPEAFKELLSIYRSGNTAINGKLLLKGPVQKEGSDKIHQDEEVQISLEAKGEKKDKRIIKSLIIQGNTNLVVTGDTKLNGTTVDHLRIEEKNTANKRALSIGGHGTVEVDAPKVHGGRFKIDEAGTVTIGKGKLKAMSSATIHGTTQVHGTLFVGNTDQHNKSLTVDNNGNVHTLNFFSHGPSTFHGDVTVKDLFKTQKNWNIFTPHPGYHASLPTDDRGMALGWNRTGGHSETNFYNLGHIGENLIAFQFLQKTASHQHDHEARELMTIKNNGWVGIGTNAPGVPLHVNGSGAKANSGGMYFDSGTTVVGYPSDKIGVTILSQGSILGARFIANSFCEHSDERIKVNIHTTNVHSDLATLLKINVKEYKHIDHIKQGIRVKKGVIAQELEKSFPEAVTQMSDFIPDIYQLCDQLTWDEEQRVLTCTLKQPHELIVGDKIKLITESDQEFFQEVTAINNEWSFSVKDWEEKVDKVFVYGKEVDDFRTVDYNQVSMMGISAIQALHQQVDTLEQENKDLKAGQVHLEETCESLKEENQALRNQLENEIQNLRKEIAAMKAGV